MVIRRATAVGFCVKICGPPVSILVSVISTSYFPFVILAVIGLPVKTVFGLPRVVVATSLPPILTIEKSSDSSSTVYSPSSGKSTFNHFITLVPGNLLSGSDILSKTLGETE